MRNRTSGPDSRSAAPTATAAAAAAPSPFAPATSPAGAVDPAATAAPRTYGTITITDQVLTGDPRLHIAVHYPAVSGLPDAARQDRVNAQLRAPADRALSGFAADFGQYPPEAGDNGFATVANHVAATGKLLSVRFDTSMRFPGARSVNGGVTAVTVRLDTGDPIPASAMFTPAAKDDTGAKVLALALRNHFMTAGCADNPGFGDKAVAENIADALRDKPGAAVLVVPNGLWFSFGPGSIAADVCGIITGLLLFTDLTQFVDPALVALAGAY
ncbi:hypothetical protein Daura_28930 [Dactylosporangium aurantiacum]|uniref:Uncharacterized protein n=1 Tax=Dactylosporangium aurantiacum TaxID=35754 RepID=A0A9Q9ICT5_9ACTN|nr:hypothetical protein [Dactylosporangium aurantiacum]UWZ50833.1 hypothetical protein Daura_28930 [Dactylosporangium aurantiacum]